MDKFNPLPERLQTPGHDDSFAVKRRFSSTLISVTIPPACRHGGDSNRESKARQPIGRRRSWIRDPYDELHGMLRQKNISEGNIPRIQHHAQSDVAEIRILAELVLEIARVHPRRRRRRTSIAANHWPLFVRMVEILEDAWWDNHIPFSYYEDGPSWLEERWRQATAEIWSSTHGAKPCRCGSGQTYRDCCAERDDVFAAQFLQVQSERANEYDLDSISWWHPQSTICPFTRCGYEAYYALGEDHPFTMVPPECRGFETTLARRKKAHRKNKDRS